MTKPFLQSPPTRAEVGEALETIVTKVDGMDRRLTTEVAGLRQDVNRLEGKHDRLEGKHDRLEGKHDRLERKVDEGFAEVRANIATLNDKHDRLETKMDDGFKVLNDNQMELKRSIDLILAHLKITKS